jgi:outer membrane beta-barrel protein
MPLQDSQITINLKKSELWGKASVKFSFVFANTFIFSIVVWAQDATVEGLDKEELKDFQQVESQLEQRLPSAPIELKTNLKKAPNFSKSSELIQESEQKDYFIVQRNYMPKTERWQFNGAFAVIPNDVFFRTMGVQGKATYHFSEKLGLEFSLASFFSLKSDELKNMETTQAVTAKQNTVRSILGMSVYFNHVYGKFAFQNRKIIPFEMYETLGLVMVQDSNGSQVGLQAGIGELFSISRSQGLRVDLSMVIYNSKNQSGQSSMTNLLLLNFGYSRFYPEPDYR